MEKKKAVQSNDEIDSVTGIFSKHIFYRRVRELLDKDPSGKYMIAVWDIDRFKVFNDVFGVEAGDKLLHDIGSAVQQEGLKKEAYGHLDADHFVFLMREDDSITDLYHNLMEWFKNYPVKYHFTIHFGVYLIDDIQTEVRLMCDRATLALRSVKSSYSNWVGRYDEEFRKNLLAEQELTEEMNIALENEQFEIYFQPQYNYATKELIGAEVLVRWNHPKRGLLAPGQFIPLFEKNGFISRLDEYVWEKSCECMRAWIDHPTMKSPKALSVNISRQDIFIPNFCERLKALVEKYKLPANSLNLEITESAYIGSPERIVEIVSNLQKMGFTIEMDDFGSGYSSLNTLKDVPVDVLKLDMKFLCGNKSGTRSDAILSSVIRMARWLNLPVIAEGVERQDQADYLKSLGCVHMQGYHFAKPMPKEEFELLLQDSNLGDKLAFSINADAITEFWDSSAKDAIIFNSFVGGSAIVEYDGEVLEAIRINDTFFEILKTTREKYSNENRNFLDRMDEEGITKFKKMLSMAVETNETVESETIVYPYNKEEKAFWIRTKTRLLSKSGKTYVFYINIENINEKKELEQQARNFNMIVDMLPGGIAVIDYSKNGNQIYINESFASIFGCSRKEIEKELLANPSCRVFDLDSSRVTRAINDLILAGKGSLNITYRINHLDGSYRWVNNLLTVMQRENGDITLFMVCLDLTKNELVMKKNQEIEKANAEKREKMEENEILIRQQAMNEKTQRELRVKAQTDALTGLLNRATTQEQIEYAMNVNDVSNPSALFVIDLDNFKAINDTLGHLYGDEILRQAAQRIKSVFRKDDIIGRYGGDEIVAYMNNAFSEEIVRKKAKEILDTISQIDMPQLGCLHCSIGVNRLESWASDFEVAFSGADIALYGAKEKGKNCYVIYKDSDRDE